jgi:alpha-L-fucosidase
MNVRYVAVVTALVGLSLGLATAGQARATRARGDDYHADPKAVQWFRDARFGMFIHWGVYSMLGRGEWVMNNEGIPISEYEKLPPRFNPTRFNAREWVKLAKDSGIRYITITSKHHDGFAMYHSQVSDYNIVDRTPFHRDPLKELADECHRQGIKLFFYYSQLDWHHPDYYPRGGTGQRSGRPDHGDWNRYKQYYMAQVRELCTNYGEIGGLWFDGWWDKRSADWGHDELYPMIHRLQPQALIGNNHHVTPFPGEDFQMFEQDLPGQNSAGFNTAQESHLPYETCRTMNDSWGYNAKDQNHRPATELIRYLVQAAGRDANLLLNTGPLPTGEILPEHQERYRAMGAWLKTHGQTVYGTRGGPFRPQPWGVSTYHGDRVYLHVLNWPTGGTLNLAGFNLPIRSAKTLEGADITADPGSDGLRLTLPDSAKDPVDSIVVLRLREPLREMAPIVPPPAKVSGAGTTTLTAAGAQVTGAAHYEAGKDCIGYWTSAADTVSWKVNVERARTCGVDLTYACDQNSGGSVLTVSCNGQSVTHTVAETGSWTTFRTAHLGVLGLPSGPQTLTVGVQRKPGYAVMNLRALTLGEDSTDYLGLSESYLPPKF